jgi:hypothetical protein
MCQSVAAMGKECIERVVRCCDAGLGEWQTVHSVAWAPQVFLWCGSRATESYLG